MKCLKRVQRMNRKRISIGLAALAAVGAGVLWMVWNCHHKYSRPFMWKRGKLKVHYVVCLECGKEYLYDMDTFKVGAETKVDIHDILGSTHVI